MNTKIVDHRYKELDTEFLDLRIGDFFQDDCSPFSYEESICMKVSEVDALRFLPDGEIQEDDWSTSRHTKIIPLKATITVERGE